MALKRLHHLLARAWLHRNPDIRLQPAINQALPQSNAIPGDDLLFFSRRDSRDVTVVRAIPN
jgi:hypothetical protein